ncbi:MAG: CinA family protein [Treponema sp.]|jgi:PncC family amidohydrolase|nr:CinA family protein [Treponema sp.]
MSECDFIDQELRAKAEKTAEAVMKKLNQFSLTLSLAESCTAGLVSGLLTNTSGASANFWGSFVCYMLESKVIMLGLDNKELLAHGVVSRQTACSMAISALQKSGANITSAVTGFAGPDGDSNARGGTIWTATVKQNGEIHAKEFHFTGSRNMVRMQAAIAVLEEILKVIPYTK